MRVEISKYKKLRGACIFITASLILIPSVVSLFKKIFTGLQVQTSSILTFENLEIEFENIYSRSLENQIRTLIQSQTNQISLLNFDIQKFYLNLKNQFPIIKSFSSRINTSTLNLKIVGITPFCLINKEMLLGNKKQLFPITLFDQFNITSLNNISINNNFCKNFLSKDLYAFIKQIPNQIWQNYEINFIKTTEIYLTPKNQSLKYIFISSQKIILNAEKFTKAQELYQKLIRDKKMKPKKNQIILIDLRFKNRIITRLENSVREGGG